MNAVDQSISGARIKNILMKVSDIFITEAPPPSEAIFILEIMKRHILETIPAP